MNEINSPENPILGTVLYLVLTMKSDAKEVVEICRKLSISQLNFVIKHSNEKFIAIIAEILGNIVYSQGIFKRICRKKRFKKLKEPLSVNKADILKIINNPKVSRALVKKQVGSGLITGLIGLLATILPSVLAK